MAQNNFVKNAIISFEKREKEAKAMGRELVIINSIRELKNLI